MKDDDLISEAKDFYEEAESYESRWRDEWFDDLDFRALKQWPSAVLQSRQVSNIGEPPRPCLVFDQVDQYVRQVINDARMNPPALQALPVDDKADVQVAEALQGLFRYIESVSRATAAYNTALDWSATIGRGFIRLYSDQVDEYRNLWEPRIGRISNAMHVWYDPHSVELDGSDATDAMLVVDMSRSAFKRKYGSAGATIEWMGNSTDWINRDTIRVAEWHSCREESRLMVITADGMMTPEQAEKRQLINFREEKQKVKTARIRKMTGAEVLEDTEFLGGGVGLVPVYGNERYTREGRQIFGLVRAAKDPQRMLNYLASNFAEAANGQTRAPWIVAHEAVAGFEQQWDRANQTAVPYLLYNHKDSTEQPLPPPARQNVDLNLDGYANALVLQQGMLQASIGMYQASIGAQGQEKSGVAIRERSNQSDVSTFHYISNLGASIQHIGRMIMKMIPEQYDTARVQKILGQDGESGQVMIDPSAQKPFSKGQTAQGEAIDVLNPLIGEYDIQISIGPSFSSKRQEAAAAIGEQIGRNPALTQLVGDIYYANQDWPGAKEMSKRLKLMLPDQIKAAEDEGSDVPAEVLSIVQKIEQSIQMREQQWQQSMQVMQKLKADLDKSSTDAKLEKASIEIERVRTDAARGEMRMQGQILEQERQAIEARIELATEQLNDMMNEVAQRGKGLDEAARIIAGADAEGAAGIADVSADDGPAGGQSAVY